MTSNQAIAAMPEQITKIQKQVEANKGQDQSDGWQEVRGKSVAKNSQVGKKDVNINALNGYNIWLNVLIGK